MKPFIAIAFFVAGIACIIGRFVVATGCFAQYIQDSSPRPTILFGLGLDQLLGIAGIVFLLLGAWLVMRNDAAKNKIE